VVAAQSATEAAPVGVASELRLLWRNRPLLAAMVLSDLKTRYIGSSIGLFWTIVNPVMELATYTFVFHVLLQVRFHPGQTTGQYVLFLFCGMLAWGGFADGLVRATTAITSSAHLLRKVNFPAVVLPAQMVATAVINQMFRLVVLLVFCMLIGDGLTWHILLLPPFLLAQALFTFGMGMLLAVAAVYFRDVQHWVNAALLIGMFITPVVYPASAWPRQYTLLLYPNPMAQYIGIYQSLILGHHLPTALTSVLYAFIASGLAVVVGASVFAHSRRRFADMV
jgi:ABC-type polysaccharide/polyol phosphate export permease